MKSKVFLISIVLALILMAFPFGVGAGGEPFEVPRFDSFSCDADWLKFDVMKNEVGSRIGSSESFTIQVRFLPRGNHGTERGTAPNAYTYRQTHLSFRAAQATVVDITPAGEKRWDHINKAYRVKFKTYGGYYACDSNIDVRVQRKAHSWSSQWSNWHFGGAKARTPNNAAN